MIFIVKGEEPEELKKVRDWTIEEGCTPEQAYDKLQNPEKRVVRNHLAQEQGHLCAYCMCRIPRPDVENGVAPIIIEHYIPRNPTDGRDLGQGLDYNNLLAVCHGNKSNIYKHGYKDLTCDAHRGNIEFRKVNPCDASTLKTIFYHMDGRIDASDPDVKIDLVETLNLNCSQSPLIGERKAVLDALLNEISIVSEEELLDYCNLILEAYEQETDPKTPYAGVIFWYLRDMIAKLEKQKSK